MKEPSDVQRVIDGVIAKLPDVEWTQLQVKYPADDDNLWFFSRRDRQGQRVQIEPTPGSLFLVEGFGEGQVRSTSTIAETIEAIVEWLR